MTRRSDPSYKYYNEVEGNCYYIIFKLHTFYECFQWISLGLSQTKQNDCFALEGTSTADQDPPLQTNVVNHLDAHGKNMPNTVLLINDIPPIYNKYQFVTDEYGIKYYQ